MLVGFVTEWAPLVVWHISTLSPYNYFANTLAKGKGEGIVDFLAFTITEHFEKYVAQLFFCHRLCAPDFSISRAAIIFNELIRDCEVEHSIVVVFKLLGDFWVKGAVKV